MSSGQCARCKQWQCDCKPFPEEPANPAPPAGRLTRELHASLVRYLDGQFGLAFRPCHSRAIRELVLAALAAEGETPPAGSVMVRVDPVYAEQMRGDGLCGPFERIRLVEPDGGEPHLELTTATRPNSLRTIAEDLDFCVDVTEPREARLQRFIDILSRLPLSEPPAPVPALTASGGDAPPMLVALVREWQDARKPYPLDPPGVGIAEAYQHAVYRMRAADEALARVDLNGPAGGALGGQAVPPESTGTSPMPDVRAGDVIDLVDPDVQGWVVGSDLDSPAAWKNPKAARRIVAIWRAVWRREEEASNAR